MTALDTFGLFEHATHCIDGQLEPNLTEVELPPPPPSILHARFVNPNDSTACLGMGLRLNLQDFWVPDTFLLQISQPPQGAYPITVSWTKIQTGGAAPFEFDLSDVHGGTSIHQEMLTTSSVQIENDSSLVLRMVGYGIVGAVGDPPPNVPQRIALFQNYPNPFNGSTTIRYELPTSGHVTLSVTDELGRTLRTLVDDVEQAGYHVASFDAALLASGEYYYTLRSGEVVLTKKLLLLK